MAGAICLRCDAPLPAGAPVSDPPGLCPACVVVAAPTVPATPGGAPEPPAATLRRGAGRFAPGTKLGPYTIVGEVGAGGMAVVYRARQAGLERDVALKVLAEVPGAPRDRVERFLQEARAAARLSHPHIVPVHDVGEAEGVRYLAMEFIPGRGLDAEIRHETLEWRRAATVVRDAARALHYAHINGVVHRDVKPANILVAADGSPRVTDFGLARVTGGQSLTADGTAIGTPAYMAPEQAAGARDAVGPHTDVYALGAVCYECLTGRPPALGDSVLEVLKAVQTSDPPPIRKFRSDVPPDLETVVEKALRKDARERYPTAEGLADDLEAVLGGRQVQARPPAAWTRVTRAVRRHRALVGGAAIALVGIGIGVAGLAGRGGTGAHAGSGASSAATAALARAEAQRKGRPAYDRALARMEVVRQARRAGDAEGARTALAEATTALDEALGFAPDWAEALLQRARCQVWGRAHVEALQTYGAVIARDPALADAYYERMRLRFDRLFAASVGSGAEDVDARDALAADLAALTTHGARPERGHAGRAMVHLLAAELDGASETIAAALAVDRYFADAYALRAAVHIARGYFAYGRNDPKAARPEFKAAVEDYGLAVQYGADPDLVLAGRAQVLNELGRVAEARADADRLLALDPEDPMAWLLSARVSWRSGDRARAEREIDGARARGGNDAATRLGAASVYLTDWMAQVAEPGSTPVRPADMAAARTELDWVVQHAPTFPVARFFRAMTHQADGDFSATASDLSIFLQQAPQASAFREAATMWLGGIEGIPAVQVVVGSHAAERAPLIQSLKSVLGSGTAQALASGHAEEVEQACRAALTVVAEEDERPAPGRPKARDAPKAAAGPAAELDSTLRAPRGRRVGMQEVTRELRDNIRVQASYTLACALATRAAAPAATPEQATKWRTDALGALEAAAAAGFRDQKQLAKDARGCFAALAADPRFVAFRDLVRETGRGAAGERGKR